MLRSWLVVPIKRARYVRARDEGCLTATALPRPQLLDDYLLKIEEWMEASKGKIRADVAHDKLGMGFTVQRLDRVGRVAMSHRRVAGGGRTRGQHVPRRPDTAGAGQARAALLARTGLAPEVVMALLTDDPCGQCSSQGPCLCHGPGCRSW